MFRRYGIPFCVYAPTDYIDGNGDLWWLTLEAAIQKLDRIVLSVDGVLFDRPTAVQQEKEHAFYEIYWRLRAIDETVARGVVASLAETAGIDQKGICRDLIMNWEELKQLAEDPLVTIGAHTVRHYALAKLGPGAARYEIETSIARLRSCTRPPHQAFQLSVW